MGSSKLSAKSNREVTSDRLASHAGVTIILVALIHAMETRISSCSNGALDS